MAVTYLIVADLLCEIETFICPGRPSKRTAASASAGPRRPPGARRISASAISPPGLITWKSTDDAYVTKPTSTNQSRRKCPAYIAEVLVGDNQPVKNPDNCWLRID